MTIFDAYSVSQSSFPGVSFWGLWLFPCWYLVIKSGFISKIFGILLIIGGIAYLVDSSMALLLLRVHDIFSNILVLSLAIGKFFMILWLLIKGVREGDYRE